MRWEQELDLRLAEPEDGVVRFDVQYPGSPKTYAYLALAVGRIWYTTGIETGPRHTWNGIIDWFKAKNGTVVSLQRADSWEDLL